MEDNKDINSNKTNGRQNHPTSRSKVSRRELMTTAGATVLAASVAGSVSAASASVDGQAAKSNGLDVIVIGGGFCGVTAARELRHQGYNVTLLEARNRLGGRTFTTEFAGEMTDMGGTWVHWLQPHVWAEIRRYGMELEETRGAVAENIIYLDYDGKRGEAKASEIWGELEASTARFFEGAYEIMPRPALPFSDDGWVKADVYSIQQKLDSTKLAPKMKILLDALFTISGSSDAKDISWVDLLRWYALTGYNLAVMNDAIVRYKIKGGTKVLLDSISADADINIRLSTPVQKVSQIKDGVEVLTDDGSRLTASAVVVAVPLNVLKDINFSPALLAPKLEVSKQTHAGHGTKVHIVLDKEYPVFSGWAPGPDVPLSFILWDGVKHGKTHLIAFGPSTETLDMNDTEEVEAAIRKFLPDARVEQAFGYGWNDDPYSQGVWCVSRPGQMSKFIGDLQKKQGNIHFANSDWASGWRGFIDGAIEQGLVAAHQVRDELKR